MVIWHGVLTVKPGTREEYTEEIKKAGLHKKFLAHKGNIFYNIGASIFNPDQVIVVDGWEDKECFIAHDASAEADVWREIYAKYVTGCESELYEM